MADEFVNEYGYADDTAEVKGSAFSFGLNAGNVRLDKFEWIPNGGKDGAEAEALDIVFLIGGEKKNYRIFPLTKVFGKNNEEITDRNSAEFKAALQDLNARITHILHAFVSQEAIQKGMAKKISSFKEFCQTAMAILPTNYKEIPLDIFLQYQWQPSEGQTRTYLEIPKKMSYGKWLCAAMPGEWKENRVENPTEKVTKALWYTNEKGEEHIFIKNGWFMNSNFAKQTGTNANAAAALAGGTPPPGQAPVKHGQTSVW